MHEGDHGIMHEADLRKPMADYRESLAKKIRKFLFPGSLLLLILISTLDVYVAKWFPEDYFGILAMLIGGSFITYNTIVVVMKKRRITAGVLVILALIGTAYVGEYLAGAVVAFMMIAGEFLEDITLDKTRNAVRELVRLVPDTARVRRGGEVEIVSIGSVRTGDIIVVRPGERIAADGRIIKGQAAVNESSLTGESMPVDKTEGDRAFVGTLNETGVLEIEVEKLGSDTMLGKIIKVVQEAQDNKGDTQKLADRFAAYFTPVILAICALVWFLTGDIPLDERLLRVMTVLVIACPCALVLATPTAVVATVGAAARHGALIKGGTVLESMAKVTAVCFDKTGTITIGRPKVVDVRTFKGSDEKTLLLTAAVAEKHSGHPIAGAVMDRAEELGAGEIPEGDDFRMNFGKGVEINHDGRHIEIANAKYFDETDMAGDEQVAQYIRSQENMGRTSLMVIVDGVVIGGIAVADTIRDESSGVIDRLHGLGIRRTIMLTGDNEVTGRAIAREVGIDEVQAGLLPEDKLKFIRDLMESGETVLMIGDGVNDAPALTLADVGIAMGIVGTDVAVESSDISLMSDDLNLVPQLLEAGRRTLKIVKQNIYVFAVLVNVVGIWFSGLGYLTPIAAAVVHNLSSLFVVGNSARLLNYQYVDR